MLIFHIVNAALKPLTMKASKIMATSNTAVTPANATPARALPATISTAAAAMAEIKRLQTLKRQLAEAEAKNKPPRRSKDSGNTWQIKVAVAGNPALRGEKLMAAISPKLVANANGMKPSQATLDTIRGDFLHSMRVFKSLSDADRAKLLAAL